MNKLSRNREMHTKLGRIRFVKECLNLIANDKSLPQCLCYVPSMTEYRCNKNIIIPLYSIPGEKLNKDMVCGVGSVICATGMRVVKNGCEWIRVKKFQKRDETEFKEMADSSWMKVPRRSTDGLPGVLEVIGPSCKGRFDKRKICRFEDMIDVTYGLSLNKDYEIIPSDVNDQAFLHKIPENWQRNHDVNLVRILSGSSCKADKNMGTAQNYVNRVEVSSEDESDYSRRRREAHCLFDGDDKTYWQSDGHLKHWIKLHMKKDVVISKLYITVDHNDETYLPESITVLGGTAESSLNTLKIHKKHGKEDVLILGNMTSYYDLITIRIEKNHSGGIDSRIHSIKIESLSNQSDDLSLDLFEHENLTQFPELQAYSPMQLLARATVLTRFMTIVDSVMSYLIPPWQETADNYCDFRLIRHVLPLSKVRMGLVESFIKQTASKHPGMNKVCIDRRFATRHKDFRQCPDYSQTIFSQLYEGLKHTKLDYRWKSWVDQWWVCVFLSEGLDDHGGGFRDCISDISEELCPTSPDCPIPTPFFIRSPNQSQDDIKVNSDTYVPCPSCQQLAEYTWIGKLMGACLRSSENLILSLPEFVWKKLLQQEVTWMDDFFGVDAAEVKFINRLVDMNESDFNDLPTERKTWSTILSDGSIARLRPNDTGSLCVLLYPDITEYCTAVKQTRLSEFDPQIDAIREGLLAVVPKIVLDLLTSSELEKRVCGEPTISVDDLWKCFVFDFDEPGPSGVLNQYLRSALENFTNDERSRFIKFVTGRRRLPVTIHICELDQPNSTDFFPEATTCAGYIYLPNYTSAKVAEEKLRYAIYNCMTIDTDE